MAHSVPNGVFGHGAETDGSFDSIVISVSVGASEEHAWNAMAFGSRNAPAEQLTNVGVSGRWQD
jgi:hypothetical protein